jgi:hypothetical protein
MRIFTRRYAFPWESPQRSDSTEPDLQKESEWNEKCDLELISTEKSDRSVNKVQSILTLIENLWQKAIAALTKEPELKIWQEQDRDGHIHWHAYDPLTNKSVSFASELEMLSWMENLYSRDRW